MISKISFGSKYRVDGKNNKGINFLKFQKYTISKALEPDVDIKIVYNKDDKNPENNSRYCILNTPNYMDGEIENYCCTHGIRFSKYTAD